MRFCGLQKLTLLDYPGKVACTIFTGGCNLRCPFCHNASLVLCTAHELPEEEVFSFLKKRSGLLDGICLSGGEPLLQSDVADFLEKVHILGYCVKLDTNGTFPDRLQELIDAGLVDYVAMDIKNSLESYGATVGIRNFDTSPIVRSAEILMQGNVDFEFRTTLVNGLHSLDDMSKIGAWLSGAKRYYLQTFEDSGDLLAAGLSRVSPEETENMLRVLQWNIPGALLRKQ